MDYWQGRESKNVVPPGGYVQSLWDQVMNMASPAPTNALGLNLGPNPNMPDPYMYGSSVSIHPKGFNPLTRNPEVPNEVYIPIMPRGKR